MDFNWSQTPYNQLYRTLTSSTVCAELVKHLRLSFRESFTGIIDMVVLANVLLHLNALQSIRTSWWHIREDGEVSTEFVRAVTRHRKGLERLEIPMVMSVVTRRLKQSSLSCQNSRPSLATSSSIPTRHKISHSNPPAIFVDS